MNKRIKLKIQILLLFLLVIALSLTFFGSLSVYFGSKLIEKTTLERSEYAVLALKHEFEKGLEEAHKVVNMIERQMEEYFEIYSVSTQTDVMKMINWIEPSIRLQAESQNQSKTAYFYLNPERYGFAEDIYYADQDGNGTVERQKSLPAEYYSSEPTTEEDKRWWYGPIESRKDYWTKPYDWKLDNGESIRFISYTRPIYYKDELFGVIGTDLAYEIVEKRVEDYLRYQLGTPFLVNENGFVLIPQNGVKTEDVFEKDHIVFKETLSNGWIIGMSTSREKALAPLRSFENLLWISGFFVALGVVFLSILFSRSITSPLMVMEDAIQETRGDLATLKLSDKIIHRKDEIGALAKALIQTGRQLQLITKTLEHSDNGVFITDENFHILYANKTYRDITGYESVKRESDLLTQGVYLSNKERKKLQRDGVLQGEFEQLHFNGKPYPMQLYISQTIDDQVNYLGLFKDISEQKIKDQNLNYLRFYDAATELPNRVLFQEKVEAILKEEKNASFVCLLINIDNFRIMNGLIGTEACDLLIKQFAERLQNDKETNPLVARTEGDEFAVLFKEVEPGDGSAYLLQLKRYLTKPFLLKGEQHYITVSFGYSASARRGMQSEELIREASIALNYAKNNGKNQIVQYKDSLEAISNENFKLLDRIRFAMDRKEMYIHFQPQIHDSTQRVIGVEALLRWNSNGEIISPNQFIPLAEQTRLIIPIGEFVLKEAFRLAQEFHEAKKGIVVAINISAVQLKWDVLFAQVIKLKQQFDIQNELIEFEVTESLLITNAEEAVEVIMELKNMGFLIAIDDFGTGYASLSYLKRFPVDRIKMDRSFVKDYPHQDDGSIAKLILTLAGNMNIEIVAEGVETKEQLDFLREHNCNMIQGYYYSKPLDKENLLVYIKKMNGD